MVWSWSHMRECRRLFKEDKVHQSRLLRLEVNRSWGLPTATSAYVWPCTLWSDCLVRPVSELMGLKRMMEKLGVPKTHLELKKMIVEVTGGSSNTINYRDFVKMMLGKRSAVLKLWVQHLCMCVSLYTLIKPSADTLCVRMSEREDVNHVPCRPIVSSSSRGCGGWLTMMSPPTCYFSR